MYRYLIEPILILVKLEKDDELTKRMILLLHESAKNLQSNFWEKFAVTEGLLSASLELVDNLSSIPVEEKKKSKNSIHVMLGDLHKNVAIDKLKQGENLVASMFYKDAAILKIEGFDVEFPKVKYDTKVCDMFLNSHKLEVKTIFDQTWFSETEDTLSKEIEATLS